MIKYFLVTDGINILAETPKRSNISSTIICKVIPKLNKSNKLLTYDNNFMYVKYINSNYICCIATNDIKQRICWNMIDDVSNEKQITSSIIEQKLKYFNNPDNDKIQKLQSEVDRVRDVMVENMDKILTNRESLDNLVITSGELADEAIFFTKNANRLKWSMRKRLIIIIGIIIGIAFILLSIVVTILAIYFSNR